MTFFLIILVVIIFIIYFFKSDGKEAKRKNIASGGLIKRFPNFVYHCTKNASKIHEGLEFVKDDGEYIEYRYPLKVTKNRIGYFYLELQNNFGTFLYTYALSPKGRKIEGYIKEIHNGRDKSESEDQSVFNYEFIFYELIEKMEHTKNFAEKFIDE